MTSISQTSISKSSIWVSIGTIQNSSISLSICLSFPLLAAAGNRGSKVVGTDTNIGGVGQTSRGSSSSSLRLSLCFPLAKIVTSIGGIGVSSIGKRSSSTGNRGSNRVHTGSSLATEGIIRIG